MLHTQCFYGAVLQHVGQQDLPFEEPLKNPKKFFTLDRNHVIFGKPLGVVFDKNNGLYFFLSRNLDGLLSKTSGDPNSLKSTTSIITYVIYRIRKLVLPVKGDEAVN
ncbi:unnamed protein product, partial [Brenthis ino]